MLSLRQAEALEGVSFVWPPWNRKVLFGKSRRNRGWFNVFQVDNRIFIMAPVPFTCSFREKFFLCLEFKIKTVIGFWCISCYASFDCHTTEFLLYLSYLFAYQWQQNLHHSWTLIVFSTFASALLVVCLVECLRSAKLRIFRHPWHICLVPRVITWLFICSITLFLGFRGIDYFVWEQYTPCLTWTTQTFDFYGRVWWICMGYS